MRAEDDAEGYARDDHEASYDISLDPEDRTAVFDLALKDDSSDGGLLDWETFAGQHVSSPCLTIAAQSCAHACVHALAAFSLLLVAARHMTSAAYHEESAKAHACCLLQDPGKHALLLHVIGPPICSTQTKRAGKHRYACCGCDCSYLPCCACVPPAWWYSYSRRQRLLMQSCAILCGAAALVAGGITLTVWFSLSTCHGGFMC